MQDRPTAAELAEAVRGFLEEEILPVLAEPQLRFRALVAANALGILERDLALGDELLREEIELLSALVGPPAPGPLRETALALNAELCRRIRRGDPPGGALQALRHIAELKLRIASPRYLEGAR
jgi:hypothetical protein